MNHGHEDWVCGCHAVHAEFCLGFQVVRALCAGVGTIMQHVSLPLYNKKEKRKPEKLQRLSQHTYSCVCVL
jgi:hypothetical protein